VDSPLTAAAPTAGPRILVAVATFRRPEGLRALLESLGRMESPPAFDVLVVDNDPVASAQNVGAQFALTMPYGLRIVHEPTPGIAAARNAALDAADAYDWVCFVDDDEIVDERWLAALVAAQRESDADAVTGPVAFTFEDAPPRWAILGNFYIRPDFTSGDSCPTAATNNVMLRVAALRERALRFDPEFGTTGGSDIMLTRRLTETAGRIVWTDDAVVHETVPAARCRSRWLLRRAVRSGNTSALVDLALRSSSSEHTGRSARGTARVALGGVARIVFGAARIVSAPWIDRQVRGAAGLRTLLRGVGVVAACMRRPIHEYGR
jgi:succinoglycan biosynthesis protein ExoM